MTLQSEERNALISYRIEKSLNTFKEAEDNGKLGHWNLAVQRLYYSVFYMESALLLKKDLTASSHAGVKSMINLHFVKNNILTLEDGNLAGRLFNMQQSGDYQDNFDWDREDVEPLIPKTEKLLNKLKEIIEEK